MCERIGLAGSRAGNDEQRTRFPAAFRRPGMAMLDSTTLHLVEAFKAAGGHEGQHFTSDLYVYPDDPAPPHGQDAFTSLRRTDGTAHMENFTFVGMVVRFLLALLL